MFGTKRAAARRPRPRAGTVDQLGLSDEARADFLGGGAAGCPAAAAGQAATNDASALSGTGAQPYGSLRGSG